MKKLFLDEIDGEFVTVTGEKANHIGRSLRMKIGDTLFLSCGDGNDYGAIIENMTKDSVELKICYKQANKSEPTVKVTLFQGVPKGDKMEDIIQKCTELGVFEIQPVLCDRSVSRPNDKSAEKKCERYNKIALEASQQSGRGIVPKIKKMTTLKEAIKNDDAELKIVFYEGGGESLKSIISSQKTSDFSVSIYIGPEGGFEKSEVDLIKNSGAVVATLGERILRTQTAPVVALSAIMLLTNNLE